MIKCLNKNSHRHIQFCKQVPDFFLICGQPVHHPIVFNSPESLIITISDLVSEILARIVFKHTIVKCIIQLKWLIGIRFFTGVFSK